MMDYSVTVECPELKRFLKSAPDKVGKAVEMALTRSALKVQNRGKENAPFKTGDLGRSITKSIKKDAAYIGSNKDYAAVREFNTKRLPNGYLRPALSDSQSEIEKIFKDEINRAIK